MLRNALMDPSPGRILSRTLQPVDHEVATEPRQILAVTGELALGEVFILREGGGHLLGARVGQ